MPRTMDLKLLPCLLLLLLPVACSSDDDDNSGGDDDDGGGGGGLPTLTADDAPGTSPCPSQEILGDAAQFATFQTALLEGTYLYLDVPFNGSDPDIFKKKCGFEEFWDPADNVNEIAPFTTPVTVSSLFVTGNAGICAEGFTASSFGTGEGFPEAGVYRKEFKVTHASTTYLVRVRVTVSGPLAGETFDSQMITVPGDLEDTLGYEIDGEDEDHDEVLEAIADALGAGDASVMLDVLDAPGGNVILSALVEFLCVEIE